MICGAQVRGPKIVCNFRIIYVCQRGPRSEEVTSGLPPTEHVLWGVGIRDVQPGGTEYGSTVNTFRRN